MKKIIISLVVLSFLLSSFSLAQTSTPTSSNTSTPTPTPTSTHPSYKTCVEEKVKELAKEKNEKRRALFREYREKIKNATTTEAKEELRKELNFKLRELNKWYAKEVNRINRECLQFKKEETKERKHPTSTNTSTETEKTTPTTSESVVIISDAGFNPKELTVNKGTKVTFVNQSSSASWPASDVHPTHRLYPGSGIEKCGTSQQNKIFDACRGLKPGESWSFVFEEVGEWSYHDHLNPSNTGKIIVR